MQRTPLACTLDLPIINILPCFLYHLISFSFSLPLPTPNTHTHSFGGIHLRLSHYVTPKYFSVYLFSNSKNILLLKHCSFINLIAFFASSTRYTIAMSPQHCLNRKHFRRLSFVTVDHVAGNIPAHLLAHVWEFL